VTDANGNTGTATSTVQLTDSAANGDGLTPQPSVGVVPGRTLPPDGRQPIGRFDR